MTAKLFSLTTGLKLYSHSALGTLVTKDGENLSFIVWPDGTPCLLANLYLLSLKNRIGRGGSQGLSTRGRAGGTIGEYASQISQLVSYCYHNRTDFIELTDGMFHEFIGELRAQHSETHPNKKKKSEGRLLHIGRECLSFLTYVGRIYEDEKFVSEEGTIKTTKISYRVKTRSGRIVYREYIHHNSLTITGTRVHRRLPISAENIQRLRSAVDQLKSTRHVNARRHLLISLLEHTGARRGEIGNIMVEDIRRALSQEHPMLRLTTLKKGPNSERVIPITKMLLNEADKYIKIYRSGVLKKLKIHKDHGFLFLSETNGKMLAIDSITSEISKLKKAANIKSEICAHMFRHAFITNLFISLIKVHELKSPDQFRKHLIDSKTFLLEVMQWTGHSDTLSLERYIHLAFKLSSNYHSTVSSVRLHAALRIFDQEQQKLLNQLKSGLSLDDYAYGLKRLVELRDEDIQNINDEASKHLDETTD